MSTDLLTSKNLRLTTKPRTSPKKVVADFDRVLPVSNLTFFVSNMCFRNQRCRDEEQCVGDPLELKLEKFGVKGFVLTLDLLSSQKKKKPRSKIKVQNNRNREGVNTFF